MDGAPAVGDVMLLSNSLSGRGADGQIIDLELAWQALRASAETPLANVKRGRHRRNRTNVWSYLQTSSFSKEGGELSSSHPTVKPVNVISDVLRDVNKCGDVVLDTFLGPGSTLMAAQQTGRVCCGVELDPLYVDVAIRPWQNSTGRDAVLVKTGEPFNGVAQRLLAIPAESSDGA
jgi:hypothetical protein